MLVDKTFTAASDDVADWQRLDDAPADSPDGAARLRVFAVTNNASSTTAKITAALVYEIGGEKIVLARMVGTLDTSGSKASAYDGSSGNRVADVTWDESSSSLLDLVGSVNIGQGQKAYWAVGVTALGGLTSIRLFAATTRKAA